MALTKREIKMIKELRAYVNWERANFDGIADRLRMETSGNNSYIIETTHEWNPPAAPVDIEKRYTLTEWIKERTRLHRESWINPVFAELLGEKEDDYANRHR